jgi:hypothetical protein
MTDLSMTIAPKSDQLNSDDLIAGPITITITRVSGNEGNPEQPINIFFDGDGGKPYRPCKSMRRVLVHVWGKDGSQYSGRSMTLYRDPDVQFGGLKVGGTRISHMSHIDGPITMALTATRANRKPFTVKPLVMQAARATAPDPAVAATLDALKLSAASGTAKLEADWKSLTPDTRKALRAQLPGLKQIAATADASDDIDDFASSPAGDGSAEAGSPQHGGDAGAATEGRADDQRGEPLSLEQALDEIRSAPTVKRVNELVAAHKAALPEDEDAIMTAGAERCDVILREKA